jgi:hypothetical protein
MALLDIFGDTPSYYGGLLGEEELRKAKDYAQQQGLQNAAMALLQAGAPSRTPGGGALAIAQGLQMGQNAYRDAMGEALKGKLTQMQLEDMLQKRAEEKALREQQVRAQQVIQSGYRPEMGMIGNTPSQVLRDEEGNLMPLANIRPAGLDLQSVMPALRAMGPAGTKALTEQLGIEKTLADLAKSQRPEGFTLGEGQVRYEVNPQGQIVPVATGAPKQEQVAGDVREAMQVLGIMKPIGDLNDMDRKQIQGYIDRKEALKAPKVAVDLKDPTATARASLDVMNKWENVLKDSGAIEVSNRFRALQSAVNQAQQGNANADGAIIYNVGKIYDPSGAVQEGDKKTILGNRSIPQEIKAYAQRVFQGGSLTTSERNNLLTIAEGIAKERQAQLEPQRQNYQRITQTLGGDVSTITDPFAAALSKVPEVKAQPTDLRSLALEELKRRRGQ